MNHKCEEQNCKADAEFDSSKKWRCAWHWYKWWFEEDNCDFNDQEYYDKFAETYVRFRRSCGAKFDVRTSDEEKKDFRWSSLMFLVGTGAGIALGVLFSYVF